MLPVQKPGTPEELVKYLVHHGVKGQKWGVVKERETSDRRFTLSNVKQKNTERKERKVAKFEDNARRTQVAIDNIKANPSKNRFVQRGRNNQVKELEKYRDQNLKDAKAVREGHLTSTQKKVLVGAAAAGTILAAYGAFKFVDSGTAHQMLNRNVPFKKNDLLSRKMSPDRIMEEVVFPINPEFGMKPGSMMNCRRCTFAYEMRRRGNDVKATQSIAATGQTVTGLLNATNPEHDFKTGTLSIYGNIIKERFSKDKTGPVTQAVAISRGFGREPIGKWGLFGTTSAEKSRDIFEALAEHPEGARGELGMAWNQGGGHSMAWEIIGGIPHIFDTQTGAKYSTPEDFDQISHSIQEVAATRLDDLPLNSDFLRRWVTNVE